MELRKDSLSEGKREEDEGKLKRTKEGQVVKEEERR